MWDDDDTFGGICVGHGAQIVVGTINNPLCVIANQVTDRVDIAQYYFVRYPQWSLQR